jgi:hypothetical protein
MVSVSFSDAVKKTKVVNQAICQKNSMTKNTTQLLKPQIRYDLMPEFINYFKTPFEETPLYKTVIKIREKNSSKTSNYTISESSSIDFQHEIHDFRHNDCDEYEPHKIIMNNEIPVEIQQETQQEKKSLLYSFSAKEWVEAIKKTATECNSFVREKIGYVTTITLVRLIHMRITELIERCKTVTENQFFTIRHILNKISDVKKYCEKILNNHATIRTLDGLSFIFHIYYGCVTIIYEINKLCDFVKFEPKTMDENISDTLSETLDSLYHGKNTQHKFVLNVTKNNQQKKKHSIGDKGLYIGMWNIVFANNMNDKPSMSHFMILLNNIYDEYIKASIKMGKISWLNDIRNLIKDNIEKIPLKEQSDWLDTIYKSEFIEKRKFTHLTHELDYTTIVVNIDDSIKRICKSKNTDRLNFLANQKLVS